MESLAAHFAGFLFLFPLGLRRLLLTSSLYLQNPSSYRSKLCFFSHPTWKNIDLYFLLIALPFASLYQYLTFSSLSTNPTYRFSFLLQSFSLFTFWLLLLLSLAHEYFSASSLVNESLVFIFGSICFLVEYFVIGKGTGGLAGVVYGLLGSLDVVCFAACLCLSIKPSAFFADFFLSLGLVLKATWLLQGGFSLYTDGFVVKGCEKISPSLSSTGNVDVHCELEVNRLRGIVLMHLVFIVHAIVVLVLSIGLFGLLARNRELRCGESKGPLLDELDSPQMLVHALPEQEME